MTLIKNIGLFLPIIYLVISIFVVLLNIPIQPIEIKTLRFIANFVFLNTIHVAFTYVMIFSLGEVKTWWLHRFKSSIAKLKLVCAFLASGAFGVFLATEYSNYNNILMITVFAAFLFLPVQHSLMQHYGLIAASLFKQSGEVPKVNLFGSNFCFPLKWVFNFFNLLNFLYIFIFHLQLKSILSPGAFFITRNILVLLFLGLIMVCFLFLLNRDFSLKKNNLLFLSRLLLYPMGYFHPIAFVFVAATHGIEYFETVLNMVRNSKFSSQIFHKRSAIFIILLIIFFGLADHNGGLVGVLELNDQNHLALNALLAVHISTTYLHYYLDREMFSFNIEYNKQNHSHLLF